MPSRDVCAEREGRKHYEDFTREPYWGTIVRVGLRDWSYLICDPAYVMCERAAGSDRPRLADLAARLGVEAFEFNVYDTCDAVLLECAPDGQFRVTGSTYNLADDIVERFGKTKPPGGWESISFPFFAELIRGDQIEPRFSLMNDAIALNALIRDFESTAEAIRTFLLGVDHVRSRVWGHSVSPFGGRWIPVNWTPQEEDPDLELYFHRVRG